MWANAPPAMIQGSAWPGSWMMPMWVHARRPVSSTFFQIVDPVPGALSGRRPAAAVEHDEVALQPQAIIPFAFLTQADQIGRAVEAHQPDLGPWQRFRK